MFTIAAVLAALASFLYLLCSPTPRSHYHSLFISDSLSRNASISQHLYTLTRRPHVAGSDANSQVAAYVLSTLSSCNVKARVVSYQVSLTYPVSRSLTLQRPPPDKSVTFDLKQQIYEGDPYADVADQVLPTFHAYAKSGTVTGPVVYANYGRVEDFDTLKHMNVCVSRAIVVARYGEIFRGDIVKNAFEAGGVGVVVYTDRIDYGGGANAKCFPDDKWMPQSGVQVGTVNNGLGDPTTPGWASIEGCERLSDDEVEKSGDIPLIPSLPISAADGEVIMRSVGGPTAKEDWQGSKDASVYRMGPGPGVLNLSYTGKQVITRIENVIGVIEGAEEPDRFVILGNHRDAWTFGAVDPNSGTAALLEIAQRLEKLQKRGWRPRRTIILCNWDAEEYGLLGSTEWVEENRGILASRAVAYLNVDCAVSGPGFLASATPQLDQLLIQATKQVQDPENSTQTIYESWIGSGKTPMIGRLGGGGSDYASFVQHIGIPATDMLFGGGYPVYHSMYDDFVWMKKFGDPNFQRHVAVASVWGLVALRLADDKFLPLDYHSYALELQRSAKELQDENLGHGVSLSSLFKSIEELSLAATNINNQIKAIEEPKYWKGIWRQNPLEVRELNDRLMMAERALTDRDGLSERPWYKHMIYGPSKNNDYGSESYPGIDDAVEKAKHLNNTESWNVVQHEIWRVSRAITHASLVLNGRLT